MAEENHDDYKMSPAALNETIKAVRDYLNVQIKDKAWDEIRSEPGFLSIFQSEPAFRKVKGSGVGRKNHQTLFGR